VKKTRRSLAITLAIILVLALGAFVQLPLAAVGPGPTFNTLGQTKVKNKDNKIVRVPVIEISGTEPDQVDGNLDMVTVNVLTGFGFFTALQLGIKSDWSVVPRSALFPKGISNEQMSKIQAAEMSRSENAAITAAMNYLDYPIATYVGAIFKDSPAAGKLKSGDQIAAVNGKIISLSSDVHAALRGTKAGDKVAVSVIRDGQPITHTIALKSGAPDVTDRGLLGVGIYSEPIGPIKVRINLADVGGPSAGLMFTLAIIDKLSPGSLTAGKHIAGTGTMDYDGTVGPIGGITHKLVGAQRAGAKYFFVPSKNCAEAVAAPHEGITLVRVTTLQSALDSLAKIRAGEKAPTCPVNN